MPGISVKVALKQEFDAEEGLVWKAEVKDWGLKAQHEVLENCLDIMQRKIVTYLQEVFGTKRKIFTSTAAASARVEFDIEVQKDRTLNEFTMKSNDGEYTATITGPDGRSVTCTQEQLELAEKVVKRCAVTGETPEDLIAQAKKQTAAKKGKGAPE